MKKINILDYKGKKKKKLIKSEKRKDGRLQLTIKQFSKDTKEPVEDIKFTISESSINRALESLTIKKDTINETIKSLQDILKDME